jgi:hypothetical protein
MNTYANLIAPITANVKLGKKVATNYRPVGNSAMGLGTCPSGCKLLNTTTGLAEQCYTKKFHTNLQQNNSRQRSDSMDRFLLKGAELIRLHTTGDFFKPNADAVKGYSLDLDYWADVLQFAIDNPHVTIYTYTHDIQELVDNGIHGDNLPANFKIVASCDNLVQIAIARQNGFKTARVIESPDDIEAGEVFCPYDKATFNGVSHSQHGVTCQKCKLCFTGKHNIAFLRH